MIVMKKLLERVKLLRLQNEPFLKVIFFNCLKSQIDKSSSMSLPHFSSISISTTFCFSWLLLINSIKSLPLYTVRDKGSGDGSTGSDDCWLDGSWITVRLDCLFAGACWLVCFEEGAGYYFIEKDYIVKHPHLFLIADYPYYDLVVVCI